MLIKLGSVSLKKQEESVKAIRVLRENGFVTVITSDKDANTYDFDLAYDTSWTRKNSDTEDEND